VLDTLPENTIDKQIIAEHLRTFLYSTWLRMAVTVTYESGDLTQGEADDLHSYLESL
jgi:hypothetical protein